jgi:hypothetical protein
MAVAGGEVLRERSEEDIPSLITCAGGLGGEQRCSDGNRLVSELLQELSHQPPPMRIVLGMSEMPRQVA